MKNKTMDVQRRGTCARTTVAGWLLFALMATGCASGPNANPRDPLEPFNRQVTKFNEAVDAAVLKPVATGYVNVVPSLVRTGVSNFFGNLGDAWSFVNNVLQAKPQAAAESFMRFNVNTFLGLGGLLDIASEMNIDRHKEDFGQTLGYWGVPSGPYLVVPILGPSTLRDALVLPVEAKGNLVGGINDDPTRYGLTVLQAVDIRANLLRAGKVLDEAALDKYTFQRDVFLQLRSGAVSDGALPPEPREPPPPAASPAAADPPAKPAPGATPPVAPAAPGATGR
jgi:phospholipid-binding lipoprotein MlaA